jgi:hypothetical protein
MDNIVGFVYRLLLTKTLDESFPNKIARIDYVIKEFTFQYKDKGVTVDLTPCSDFLKKYRAAK